MSAELGLNCPKLEPVSAWWHLHGALSAFYSCDTVEKIKKKIFFLIGKILIFDKRVEILKAGLIPPLKTEIC